MSERLAKVIARRGLASRREAEVWIQDGRVTVNGEVVYHPGHPVDDAIDLITVDDQALPAPPKKMIYLLFKPKGTITGRDDPEGRRSVLSLVEHLPERVEPIGRLDMDTEGALLFTNDGELAHKLTHPSMNVPKRYVAKVWRTPSERTMNRLRAGIKLEDGRTSPCKARVIEVTDNGNAWIEITVTEGRNRLIRRMFQAVNHPVAKLRRESFATISIRNMARSEVRPLTKEERTRLDDLAAGKDPRKAGKSDKRKTGHARAKPRPNKPLSKKKALARRKVTKR
jgi:23S rRNA pseudouridine2605 synthase